MPESFAGWRNIVGEWVNSVASEQINVSKGHSQVGKQQQALQKTG